jgi:hypothetical protein
MGNQQPSEIIPATTACAIQQEPAVKDTTYYKCIDKINHSITKTTTEDSSLPVTVHASCDCNLSKKQTEVILSKLADSGYKNATVRYNYEDMYTSISTWNFRFQIQK